MAGRVAKPWVILLVGLWMACRVQNVCFVPPPQVVSAWRVPNQRCWHVGQLVGSCMMIAPARAVEEPAHLPSLQDYVAQNKDFLVGTAGAVATVAGSYFTYLQADEAFRASDEYKIQAAVQDFLKAYQPKKKEKEVVKRDIMNTTKKRITEWSQQTEKATIVSGRFQSGKTVAVNEALRGVRGVFQFDIKSADWEEAMYKKLRVNDEGMFKEVLRRVRKELEKFPNNPTKFPILLLEVHREVVGGVDAMKLVSTTAKTLATDGADQAPTHVIVSCSSAAFALAFDAGGSGRQQDVWVGGFTRDEAEQLAKLNGCGEDDWTKIQPIVEKCDYRAGDVVDVCTMIKSGISPKDIETKLKKKAKKDVVGFASLTLEGKDVGSQMLQELLDSSTGMEAVVGRVRYEPREIAAEIRNKNAHAVLWNPEEDRYFFASEMHREAAKTLQGQP